MAGSLPNGIPCALCTHTHGVERNKNIFSPTLDIGENSKKFLERKIVKKERRVEIRERQKEAWLL
jgi:hypothetical protein